MYQFCEFILANSDDSTVKNVVFQRNLMKNLKVPQIDSTKNPP